MGPLARRLREHLDRSGLSDKAVAMDFQTECGESLSDSTVPPKLSKLLGGSPEGKEFFRKTELRVAALAKATQLDSSLLRRWFELDDAFRTLVVDKALGREILEAYQAAAEANPDVLGVVVADSVERDGLRDAARRQEGSIVVTAAKPDVVAFLEGAGHAVSAPFKSRGGWTLQKFPELVPPPPPPAPVMHDDNGTPMVPDALLQKELLERSPRDQQAEVERVRRVVNAGGTPTFAVTIVLQRHHEVNRRPTVDHLFAVITRGSKVEAGTFVWLHEGRILGMGNLDHPVVKTIRQYHRVIQPDLGWLTDAVRKWNPWNDSNRGWGDIDERARRELGVDTASASAYYPSRCKGWRGLCLDHCRNRAFGTVGIARRDAIEEERQKAILADILQRPVKAKLPQQAAIIVLTLQSALTAPAAVFVPTASDRLHLAFNLGAGRVLSVRVAAFADPPTEELLAPDPGEPVPGHPQWADGGGFSLDGGDIHIEARLDYSYSLEGAIQRPRERRIAERDAD